MSAGKPIWIVWLIGMLVAADTAGTKDVIVPDDLAFILKNETWMTKSGQAAWHRRLRETPGITPRLLGLLWECFDSPTETLNGVVNALMYRDDIPPAELEKLSETLRRLADVGPVSQLDADRRSLFSAICLLQRASSRENEDLALLLLGCDDSLVRIQAATTLGWIGTERAVEPMRRHFDPFRYIKTDPPHEGAQTFKAEQMLLARVAAKAASSPPHQGAIYLKKPASQESAEATNPSKDESSIRRSIIVAMIVSATGLLWLLLKRRF